jgi:Zn-dependent peptidase ImmA (M78 family)/transcriptional regulator with XRE-family HTH domain
MSSEAARTASALFDPQRLRTARLARGLRKNQLARACEVTPSAITQYELGKTRPSPPLVARLALTLQFPPRYFARDGRPSPQFDIAPAFFRSLARTRQIDRDQAEAQTAVVWDLVTVIGRHVDLPEPDLPEQHLPEDAPLSAIERAAEIAREHWGIGGDSAPSIVALLELYGAVVVRLPSLTPTIDAFSKTISGRPIVVLWAGKDNARSRFDAAHELGHLVMHADPEAGNRVLEQQAHTFAQVFLMPTELVLAHLPRRAPRTSDWEALFELKRRLGVSIAALLYRARALGTLSDSQYRRSIVSMAEMGWRRSEPHDLQSPETPGLLTQAMALLTKTRGLTATALAEETHLPLDMVNSILAEPRLAAERVMALQSMVP